MMHKKYLFVLLVLVLLAVMPLSVKAAEDMSFAVVDVEKILNESKAGKSIQAQLKQRRESFQKEFSARENNLMATEKLLIQQKTDLSAEEFAKKRQDFENQLRETRDLFQKRRNSLDKGLGDALSKLRQSIIEITATIADEKGYKIVLTRDSVVIVEKDLDITEDALTHLNKKTSEIKLDVEG